MPTQNANPNTCCTELLAYAMFNEAIKYSFVFQLIFVLKTIKRQESSVRWRHETKEKTNKESEIRLFILAFGEKMEMKTKATTEISSPKKKWRKDKTKAELYASSVGRPV